ncbi:tetratricopeptide repeat protein [Collimonas sp.]|jgi:tetratricopeptide (TPR) repeat protein|uniref:tetratricopeptide repeat protein n=1 Tax=Collimonas sp. TaxID=1963772 RepID=UPI002C62AA72|nr:tetratricopeptide repeat protein [Collimonas sp.]HWW04746.1 tetratricopeptide repeat protein [Collimonas sp.]
MKSWVVLPLCIMLAACATAPQAPRADNLFNDQLFSAPSQRISVDDVFAVSPAMKEYLSNGKTARQMRANGMQQGLFDALYSKGQLKLDYNSESTRNAAQTFAARSGNCLSLVIMTAAFAKELRLPLHYQSILMDRAWSRNDDLYFASGHVNLILGRKATAIRTSSDQNRLMTIDFLPPEDTDGQRRQEIDESTIVAMYMNNRAAEALAAHQLDDAYWWAREAIRQDARFLASYNTLGVIYRRHDNLQEAERTFRQVFEREPDNPVVMFNLIGVLNDLGKLSESKPLAAKLAQVQPEAPFQAFNLGMAAMRAGDFKTAKQQFTRELARDPYYHEFQYWLGIACLRLGEMDQAVKHLSIAMENSTSRNDHDLYAAKLDRIKSYRSPLLVH